MCRRGSFQSAYAMPVVTIVFGLLPIGALISSVANEVLTTAIAAQDVLVERESFRILSQYLKDIIPVLKDLESRKLDDASAVRIALEALHLEVKNAQGVINSATGRSKFYLLIRCRTIVGNAQNVTRNIGKALQMLLLAGTEVSLNIREDAFRLKEQMISINFHAAHSQLQVMDRLEYGIQQQRIDRGFSNDLLKDIATELGIPLEAEELKSELASFKREREEAALRKEAQDEWFMEQVIAILSHAEALSSIEDSVQRYRTLAQHALAAKQIHPPFQTFICPLTQEVMVDPVQLAQTTYERAAIKRWLEAGHKVDPVTGEDILSDILRPNNSLRRSIEEWAALNDCITIRIAKKNLLSNDQEKQKEALESLATLCQKSYVNQDWIAAEGLLEKILRVLQSHDTELRQRSLFALHMLVKNNNHNKGKLAEAGGVHLLVKCLAKNSAIVKPAADLLFEMLQNSRVRELLGEDRGAILLLVTAFLTGKDTDVGITARLILEQLAEKDANVVKMATVNWCEPLICRLTQGSEESKLSMASALATMDLQAQSKQKIAEAAMDVLIEMSKSGKLDAKIAALTAVRNLSTPPQISQTSEDATSSSSYSIKRSIAAAGAVPAVLAILESLKNPSELRGAAVGVLANLSSDDGIEFLVDKDGTPVPLDQVVFPLLHCLESNVTSTMRLHVLNALLGMAIATAARQMIQAQGGIPILASQIGMEPATRKSAVKLLHILSEDEGAGAIADEIEKTMLERDLVRLLGESVDPQTQGAVAGILASLPHDRHALQSSLLAAGVLPALVTLIASGKTTQVKENAVGALRQFTQPSNIETQKCIANLDIHPLLVGLLETGTPRAKARAAWVLRDLSLSTPRLCSQVEVTGWMCFRKHSSPVCKVHKGRCSVKSTFCMLEADAVGPLVSLLEESQGEAAEAGVDALETLISDDEIRETGTQVLHEQRGIQPLFHLLMHGSPRCTDKAMQLLEIIFKVPKMKDFYFRNALMPLAVLAVHENLGVRRKAARVLARLEVGMSASR